ncbi:unnamed protein product [Psylliodes chrysocephalus]|uniref:Uncharacterized protein n=1 Tax=Psylliodes chrysocephalus TaxID=3402493 RepID=A0A9P0D589_9CUCU|nr:unnamed protein product [Psylliodes chrysocephala]
MESNKDNESKLKEIEIQSDLHQRREEAIQANMKQEIDEAKTQNQKLVLSFDLQQALPIPDLNVGKAFYLRKAWLYNLATATQKCKDVYSANDDSDNDPETFSDLENQAFEDEPSQDELVDDDSENSVCEATDVVKNSNSVAGEVKCGGYVVVNFKKFVAKIISPEGTDYTCKFLRPSLKIKNSYVYLVNDDI